METQLKLLVDPKFKDALLRHPLLSSHGGSKQLERTISDTYFDTPDLSLRNGDVGLRVRREDGNWVQHIQRNGNLDERHEWEAAVAGPAPELARLRDLVDDKKIRRQVLDAAAPGKQLAPVFSTKVKRTAWALELPNGDHIECAFDQGKLEVGDKKAQISELDLELTAGDPARLFDLALALQHDFPVHIGNKSQADRGYALLEPPKSRAARAAGVELSPDMNVEQAFQTIASGCLRHMQGNVEGVADQHDEESVHQMRVGMRRLRSALGMFKGVLHVPAEIQQEIDWLAGELGAARDWDVLSGTTLPSVAKEVRDPRPVDEVKQAAAETAREHHATAAAAVGSPRYTELMLKLNRWIEAMGWHQDPAPPPKAAARLEAPVVKFARQIGKRDERRLRKRAANLPTATPEARHLVRIAAKKARYATEFFGSLFPAKTVRPYVKALSGLQDELGYLNDAAVAERLLTEMSTARPQLESSVSFTKGFLAARVKNEDKKVLKLWRRFEPVARPH